MNIYFVSLGCVRIWWTAEMMITGLRKAWACIMIMSRKQILFVVNTAVLSEMQKKKVLIHDQYGGIQKRMANASC